MTDDAIDQIIRVVGAPYGMSLTDALAYVAIGEHRNPDAPVEECGCVDPRDETRWCRRPAGHDGADGHNRYRLDEDWATTTG